MVRSYPLNLTWGLLEAAVINIFEYLQLIKKSEEQKGHLSVTGLQLPTALLAFHCLSAHFLSRWSVGVSVHCLLSPATTATSSRRLRVAELAPQMLTTYPSFQTLHHGGPIINSPSGGSCQRSAPLLGQTGHLWVELHGTNHRYPLQQRISCRLISARCGPSSSQEAAQ